MRFFRKRAKKGKKLLKRVKKDKIFENLGKNSKIFWKRAGTCVPLLHAKTARIGPEVVIIFRVFFGAQPCCWHEETVLLISQIFQKLGNVSNSNEIFFGNTQFIHWMELVSLKKPRSDIQNRVTAFTNLLKRNLVHPSNNFERSLYGFLWQESYHLLIFKKSIRNQLKPSKHLFKFNNRNTRKRCEICSMTSFGCSYC